MDSVYLFLRLVILIFPRARSDIAFGREVKDRNLQLSHKVYINTAHPVHETDEKFLSVALGSSLIRHRWKNFNFASKKLQNLAKGLSPAYLRIGGNDQDFLLFDGCRTFDKMASSAQRKPAKTNFTMSTSDVDKIFSFTRTVGFDLIFGLNILLHDANMRWNYTNAGELMKYLVSKRYVCGWELGNEPVDLKGLANRTFTGEQLAKDFKILRQFLKIHPEYGQMIVGPDVSSPWKEPNRHKFLKNFLDNIDDTINALTYHQYYTNSQATVSMFFDPKILDLLISDITKVQNIMVQSGTNLSLWLGETSSAYGGGVPAVSNSYVAGFMWLDKLGIASRLKHNVVIRQTLYGSSYGLLDEKSLDPLPDYWSSLLYKRLVGRLVLEVRDGIEPNRTVRVYAYCTSTRSRYKAGSLVLVALNTLDKQEVELKLNKEFDKLSVDQYLLTPGEVNTLTSQSIRLNGEKMKLLSDTFVPNFQPKTIIPPEKIMLPPVSYGFYVIPDAQVQACLFPRLKHLETIIQL